MPFSQLSQKQNQVLLDMAHHSIRYGLTYQKYPRLELEEFDEVLRQPGASFVTLTETGRLRGCIGTLEPYQALIQDVAEHAYAAAFRDPRFPPVNSIEEPMIHISISILGEPEIIPFDSESELLEKIEPGKDGLILEYRHHKGTFLPSVWQQLPDKRLFLANLKQKAGLTADFWSPEITVSKYQTQVID